MRGERAKRAPNTTKLVISAHGADQESWKHYTYMYISANSNISAGSVPGKLRTLQI